MLAFILCGCGVSTQQQQFRNAFLPPTPHGAAAALDAAAVEPPVAVPSLYLSDVPTVISGATQLPPSHSDSLVAKAEEHFQLGQKYYQDKELQNARREFDQAVDLMLAASDS